MTFDRELFAALKTGLSGLTMSEQQVVRLIWNYPNVPVHQLPAMRGGRPGGGVWLVIGSSIGKKKLWAQMPRRIRRENQPPGYRPFYSGLLVRWYTVVDKHKNRFICFDFHEEAVRALQHLKIIGKRRNRASEDYTRLEELKDEVRPIEQSSAAETKRIERAIKERRGQPMFRRELLQVYGGRCAVTGCEETSVLEAAHIVGFSKKGRYEARNGLLLRADWHTLFDLGLWAVNPNRFTIEVSPRINDREYTRFHGRKIYRPSDPKLSPVRDALSRRYNQFKKRCMAA